MAPTIFGREPVVISNAIEGTLTAALAFNMLAAVGINSATDVATVMAVVTALLGIYVAYVTHDTLLAGVVALVKALVMLFAAYGFNVTDHQLAAIVGAMTMLAAIWHRTQTGPAVVPSLDLAQHSATIPPAGELKGTQPAVEVGSGVVTEVADAPPGE